MAPFVASGGKAVCQPREVVNDGLSAPVRDDGSSEFAQVQKVALPEAGVTWTVLGDVRVVEPVEEWLEYLRVACGSSPNSDQVVCAWRGVVVVLPGGSGVGVAGPGVTA